MRHAHRPLIILLVALTALMTQVGGGVAAPGLPGPARVCVVSAAWLDSLEPRPARSLPRGETDAQSEDVMIVVDSSLAGIY